MGILDAFRFHVLSFMLAEISPGRQQVRGIDSEQLTLELFYRLYRCEFVTLVARSGYVEEIENASQEDQWNPCV